MSADELDYSESQYFRMLNGTNLLNQFFYDSLPAIDYHKYVFFAVCSALLGLPANILLMVILVRIGLFSKRQGSLAYLATKPTGSFERFLFEIVFIDTLLIIYHFVDNFLSYIKEDRSSGQHYLIHVSDFCCKFFTYIAKMSVLLTTWLLLFLIINQLILTMEYNNNHRSCWNRGLYYVNAKYSTVFLIFIFSVYNIYPIEVLKYQRKEELQDYEQDGAPGGCSTKLEGKSKQLLNATNYGYSLLGVAIPCVIILVISLIIIYRTCRNSRFRHKKGTSFRYIAGAIGIIHSLFNIPGRFSDILLMFLSPYVRFFPHLISFNHQANSFIPLSYGYKGFICILISRRFRLHAKSVLCFLIESKYEERHTTEIVNTPNDWQQVPRRKKHKKYYHHHTKDSHLNKTPITKLTTRKFPSPYVNRDDIQRFTTSETISWVRPYFTQNERRLLLRPCGRSTSCHQICTTLSSNIVRLPKKYSPNECDTSSSRIITDSSSSYIISVSLPNGEYVHIPLPQKHLARYQSSSLIKNRTDSGTCEDPLQTRLFPDDIEKVNSLTSAAHLY